MEFLPLEIDGNNVYAGFWKRLVAGIIDTIILIPVAYLLYYVQGVNIYLALITIILVSILYSIYSIYFNANYGGTVGKLVIGIRITKPNGEKIGYKEAVLRSSIDILFALILATVEIYTLITSVNIELYLSSGVFDRADLMIALYPKWNQYIDMSSFIWYGSEFIVLLLNKRRRALHDYIAGTVVVHKEYV